LETQWGQLFKAYGDGNVVMPGMEPKTMIQAVVGLTILTAAIIGIGLHLSKKPKG
jgi:hypothetical protein